ncbi:MAG: tetratricopeptide repeat protein [Gammaproteobacteria bacterium]|nr:tetratricopeptide repeat protein [Gammaproteobacteria bacterium]
MLNVGMYKLAGNSCKTIFMLPLVIMLVACGTTAKVSKISTDDIVISEEFGIDTDLADKFNLAVKHINNKKYDDAIKLLLEVTSKTDKHSAPYINLGIAYAETGKIEDAENILLKAVKINPAHPVTNNELALVYRKTGRFSEAKKTYENVIKSYPQFLPARKNLGILCDLFMKDLSCAIEQYEAYLTIQPNEKDIKIWLTDLKRRAGQ